MDQITPQPAGQSPVTPPVSTPAAAPAATVTSAPAATATQVVKGSVVTGQTQTAKKAPSGKKFILGCFGAFGVALFLFIGVIFAFLAFGSTDNPIFAFLGVAPSEVYNVIFTITNFIFLVLVFLTFIFVVVGVFKRITARKDDMAAKRSGNIFIFISSILLVFFILSWVFAYFYLVDKRTVGVRRDAIVTQPAATINLTAPVTVKFDASRSLSGRTDVLPLSYSWDFGDGASARGDTQTHTYEKLGSFKVKVSIAVRNRQTGADTLIEFTKDVTIDNILANIVINAKPSSGPAPLTVAFDASDTASENGEITGFAWDLDGDGEFDDSTDAKTTYTFEEIKDYTVTLRVTDSSGQNAEKSVEISATESEDPVPVISVDGIEGTDLTTGQAYVFSGVGSTSPKGTIEKYSWEFGDGVTAQTRTVRHSFAEAGAYDVVLRVTDSTKKTAEKTVRFVVGHASAAPKISLQTTPAAAANGVIAGEVPFTVDFDASKSTDANDSIVEYRWDFDGDGKIDATNPTASYTFTKAGTYSVSLTAIDSANLSSKQELTVTATQKGLSVSVVAIPVDGSSPLKVTFDASGSSYPSGRIVSYEWDFGDGSKPRIDTAKITYQYNRIGTFTAKVTATTDDNKRSSATTSISVRPVSLNACFEASVDEGTAPLAVSFDSLCSSGTIVRYTWDFGGLKTSNERRPVYTFTKPGEYEVKLEVRDTEDVIDTFSTIIKVK